MADFVYDNLPYYLGNGTVVLSTAALKVGLLSSNHVPDPTDDAWTDVSGDEVSGTGYTAGGVALSSVTWTTADGVATLDAADPSWTGATFSARYAVLYDVTTGKLVKLFDLGDVKTVENGPFTLVFDAAGALYLAEAA